MRRLGQSIILSTALMLVSLSAKAQAPVFQPGDLVRVSITFDGPDASKINGAGINFSLVTEQRKDQPGFSATIYSREYRQTAPTTFEVSFHVPDNQVSGQYEINEIQGFVTKDVTTTLSYTSGQKEFTPITIRIENPHTVIKPSIKSVTVAPKS